MLFSERLKSEDRETKGATEILSHATTFGIAPVLLSRVINAYSRVSSL